MVTIQTVQSDVIVEDGPRVDDADKPFEVRLEELRDLVREILQEEIERLVRTEIHY
ncbi:hypothetical protein D3OALGA1CA_4385 [Olavius algarvensis associated proteobacterium Delta 3]|nr:hypothetical protein D3OALGA1CA_4385 [Olavius algarvensis associated proteobacterium Delta 3]CAB5162224.1 hypothetical protein D3OALGB2SA_5495 [Olavius algarvensis associated proteobacterium Delta 3]